LIEVQENMLKHRKEQEKSFQSFKTKN